MDTRNLLILAHNFANYKLYKHGYFLRFHRSSSSIPNKSGRSFCKLLQENDGKITNLHIQKQQVYFNLINKITIICLFQSNLSSSSSLYRVGKISNDFIVQNHRTKVDFTTKRFKKFFDIFKNKSLIQHKKRTTRKI